MTPSTWPEPIKRPLRYLRNLARSLRQLPTLSDRLTRLEQLASLLTHNVKISAYYQADAEVDRRQASPLKPLSPPDASQLYAGLCRYQDFTTDWYRYWCHQLQTRVIFHRKQWEWGWILNAMYHSDRLRPGVWAIGFGSGREPLPSLLCRYGVRVLATDLDAENPNAAAWSVSQQHAASLAQLHYSNLVSREVFEAQCQFRAVDMNQIPADLYQQFDLCWSSCALEHLGTLERGLQFICHSLAVLKPGGVAIHTTEFNLSSNGETLVEGGTVLYRQCDLEQLAQELTQQGHRVIPLSFDAGDCFLDGYVDVPPYSLDAFLWDVARDGFTSMPHLRLAIANYAATSIGLVIFKADASETIHCET
ncbi:SAM-dependent methyltransferase [Leptolyngbya sp. AN02str]|uniref:SAM-dependent methyltransferase n=1 Tax=Leptolyngbya sp. AN02str TaxID=3423363 RepID=UPI003D319190